MTPVALLLDQAATVAGKAPDVVPRDDQFVYLRYTGNDSGEVSVWYSIDGKHDGLSINAGKRTVIPGCVDGTMMGPDDRGGRVRIGCKPVAYYLPAMPTDPTAMVDWLAKSVRAENEGSSGGKTDGGGKGNEVAGMAKFLWHYGGECWLRPGQRAALYRSAAKLPGVRLVPNVKDGTGRVGTGVALASPGSKKAEVLFVIDPKTYQFLGDPNNAVSPVKLVDKAGQTS